MIKECKMINGFCKYAIKPRIRIGGDKPFLMFILTEANTTEMYMKKSAAGSRGILLDKIVDSLKLTIDFNIAYSYMLACNRNQEYPADQKRPSILMCSEVLKLNIEEIDPSLIIFVGESTEKYLKDLIKLPTPKITLPDLGFIVDGGGTVHPHYLRVKRSVQDFINTNWRWL